MSARRRFELPYSHIPVVKEARSDAESELLGLIRDRVDLVVLARYMQILSGDFIGATAHYVTEELDAG